MPVSQSGKHYSRPADMMRNEPAIAQPDGDGGEGQEIVVRKKPDGSVCTVENGQEMEHPDFASAMQAVSEAMGEAQEMGADMGGEKPKEENEF